MYVATILCHTCTLHGISAIQLTVKSVRSIIVLVSLDYAIQYGFRTSILTHPSVASQVRVLPFMKIGY